MVITKEFDFYFTAVDTTYPEKVHVSINASFFCKLNQALKELKLIEADQLVFWNAVDFSFSEDHDIDVELCEALLDKFGDVSFRFHLKYLDNEWAYTNDVSLDELKINFSNQNL